MFQKSVSKERLRLLESVCVCKRRVKISPSMCVHIGCSVNICKCMRPFGFWGVSRRTNIPAREGGQSRPMLCVLGSALSCWCRAHSVEVSPLCGGEPYTIATERGREASAPRSCLMYIINKCVFRDTDSCRLN